MKGTDVRCPACGMINKSLFLEETEGMYECERCGHTDKAMKLWCWRRWRMCGNSKIANSRN